MKKIVVIGGGASGLMAAYAAAASGNQVLLLEKNEKLGKKIYITGKGRCNLTNDCPPEDFLAHVVRGSKFLTGAAYRFTSADTMDFFERNGLTLKVERGNRVFPASDHASDVTKALERACREAGAEIRLNTRVRQIEVREGAVCAVWSEERHACDVVIVATGGLSYPSTGSTGDGYRFAEQAGHTLIQTVPSLVGLELSEQVSQAQGVSLKNAVLTARRQNKVLFSQQGELLFTHYGISGPLVLTLSAQINRLPLNEVSLSLDFKPALDEKMLDDRLLRDFSERRNEQMKHVMRGLLPAGLSAIVLGFAHVSAEKQANSVTREERRRILEGLKALPLKPVRLRGFEEAVITSGGVDCREIDPKTMQSRKTAGLYFCGEMLDCDALTGGYNLQIAFSTGYLAGSSCGN